MYGYIRAYKPEMRFREYDIYHGCYCGLCDELHKRHGAAARWTLSYDMTFLILLLTGLYEPAEEKAERRCIAHPFHKSLHIQSEITAYAADMSILLFRDKCMDDWNDERKITRRAAAEMFRKSYRRIQAQYPQKCKAVQAQLDLLHQMEQRIESGSAGRLFRNAAGRAFRLERGRMGRQSAPGRVLSGQIHLPAGRI